MGVHIFFLLLLFLVYFRTGGDASNNDLKKRKRQVSYMGFLLFLFAALRSPTVGVDVLGIDTGDAGYYLAYIQDASMSFQDLLIEKAGRDPIFHCFQKILAYIWDSPQFLLIVVGGIFAFGFSYFVYHSKGNVLLIFMMLIGFRIFSFSLSGLRQSISLGLIYIAYIYLKDKRHALFILLTVVASFFHRSAMVFFFALPLMYISSKYVLWALVLMILVNFSGGNIITEFASFFFGDRFGGYIARSANMEFGGGATFYIYIIFFLLILFFYRQMKKKDEYLEKDFSIISMGVFFAVIGQSMDAVFRIAYYFIFALFPASSLMLNCMFPDKQTSRTISFIACLLLAVQYVLLGTSAGTENYEFFWTFNYFR